MKKCCEDYLNEQFCGDAEVVAEIYGEYASSVRAKIADATAAFKSGDWQLLDRVAHTVKGNALAAGDQEMADAAIALRKAAALGDASESSRFLAAMSAAAEGL